MKQISISEWPEMLQQLLSDVQQTAEPLTITLDGKPLVVVYPASQQQQRPAFGAAKGSGEILGDLVEPTLSFCSWEVLQ